MALQSSFIRTLYLYIFASVGLVILVVGSVQLINLGFRTFVFTEADSYYSYPRVPALEGEKEINPEAMAEYQEKEQKSRAHRDLSQSLALILVGLPLFWFHVRIIKLGKND